MIEEMRTMENKNAIEITKVLEDRIITREIEFRDGLTFMRARSRKLHRQIVS